METFKNPLTQEEEKYYLQKYKEGDMKAKDMLIECNLRLVAHIVKKYISMDRDIEDLISIGTIGLIKAVNTFDNLKGNKLVTYASKCIDNEILMYLRSEKKKTREVSLYEPLGFDRDGNVISLLDIIECEDKDVVEEYNYSQDVMWLYGNLDKVLNKRELQIIIMRYGLYGNKEITQRELAKKLGISRSYVSRIEKKALSKLKENHDLLSMKKQ